MKTILHTILPACLLLLAACAPATTPAPQSGAYPAPAQTEAPSLPEAYPAPTGMAEMPASASVYHLVPGESTVTYEVGETFINRNNKFNLAVGVTDQVSGDIAIDAEAPQNSAIGVITVDVSQFHSDSNKRDSVIQDRFLESGKYPLATFSQTAITGLPQTYTAGETLTFEVQGDLTVHQITQPVTFQVEAVLVDGELRGTAAATILMSDFGIGPISIAGILNTEDEVKLTFAFVARP
ncbi:MAG: YceI family protein [Anaerolineales bacterium]